MYYLKHSFLLLIILIFSSTFFMACSEDSTGPDNDSILGEWVLSKISMEMGSYKVEYTPEEMDFYMMLEINENNTYTSMTVEEGDTIYSNGTWTTKGNKLTITEIGMTMERTYSCSASKLTIRYEDENDEGEIIIIIQEFIRKDSIVKTWVVMIDNDFDGDNGQVRFGQGICGSGSQVSYQVENVPTGTYFIYAAVFVMSDGSQGPQSGDYLGIYGGQFPNSVPANPNANITAGTQTFDISLGIFP